MKVAFLRQMLKLRVILKKKSENDTHGFRTEGFWIIKIPNNGYIYYQIALKLCLDQITYLIKLC